MTGAIDQIGKIHRAALKRARDRQVPSSELYEPDKVAPSNREAVRFFVTQLAYLEGIGPRNLERLARATKIEALAEAYRSQIDDEIAHAAMLENYRDRVGDVGRSSLLAFGSWAGLQVQRDPWLGSVCIMATIEFLSAELLPDLRARVDEPWLAAILGEIERDEHRHRALARAAASALMDAQRSRVSMARRRAAQSMVDVFFRQVLGRVFEKHASALDLPVIEIYARAREDLDDAIFA